MNALFRFLHLLVALGLLTAPGARVPASVEGTQSLFWLSGQFERIEVATQARGGVAVVRPAEGDETSAGGDGDDPSEVSAPRPVRLEAPLRPALFTLCDRSVERALLGHRHLRVNGSANAFGARA